MWNNNCCRYSDSYGYGRDKNGCNCDTFFKDISRGEEVKVYLKGGGIVFGEFIDTRGDLVFLARAECHDHKDHHHKRCERRDKVRIIKICCDDIVAVEV
ncbi:hypothetical protein RYX56_19000 [Alkalihalophilus lindianensis]|uniref:Uncharacterized protein n=1 Tax=Alkalihalophilus lindianensis TaxID=1630542 RepID=A0ABU3XEZ7_9BACI|nr:hypothetical protein [Alkalihalophilus lindianensis]MDV2686461.1 hypothetical protein [Alkalihalophilus lindianensis]